MNKYEINTILLSDYEYSKLSIIHHMTTEPTYYMTSDNTIFYFTRDNKDEVWKDAQLHEIEWLESDIVDEEDEDSHWDIRIQNLRKACKIWEGVK